MKAKRVAVIGCPGAGKTFFAKKLAQKLQLPLHHIDYYFHEPGAHYTPRSPEWRSKVSELVAEPVWIIDGNYQSTFDILLPETDTIVFLDYPLGISLGRAILRRIKMHSKVREDMPSNWKEKLSFRLFKFILLYNKVQAPKVRRMLEEQKGEKNIVILKNSREADLFLNTV